MSRARRRRLRTRRQRPPAAPCPGAGRSCRFPPPPRSRCFAGGARRRRAGRVSTIVSLKARPRTVRGSATAPLAETAAVTGAAPSAESSTRAAVACSSGPGHQPQALHRDRARQSPFDPGALAGEAIAHPRRRGVTVEGRRRPVRGHPFESRRAAHPESRELPPADQRIERPIRRGRVHARPSAHAERARLGQRHAARDPALRVHRVERAAGLRGRHVGARPVREVRSRPLQQHLDGRAGQVGSPRLARGLHRQPQRLAHAPAGQLQLVDPAAAAPALLAQHAADPDPQRAQRAPAQLDPVPAALQPPPSARPRRSPRSAQRR